MDNELKLKLEKWRKRLVGYQEEIEVAEFFGYRVTYQIRMVQADLLREIIAEVELLLSEGATEGVDKEGNSELPMA